MSEINSVADVQVSHEVHPLVEDKQAETTDTAEQQTMDMEKAVADDNQANEELDESANIAKAKRDTLHGNYVEAVSTMASVCANMSKKLGAMAYPLAQAYFVYGSALLELSRVESNILGDALDKEDKEAVEKDEKAEEKDADAKEEGTTIEVNHVIDNDGEGAEKETLNGNNAEQESDVGVEPNIEKSEVEETDSKVDAELVEENPDEGDGVEANADDSEAGDDISNLQLAWETLDLARIINERHFNELKETQTEELQSTLLAWADCLQSLAEVGMEQGQWDQAYDDALKSLSLRKQGFSHNVLDSQHILKTISQSRSLGECHYQLGTINAGKGDYELAVQEIQQCIDLLSGCIDIIRSGLRETDENVSDSREQLEKQLKDIESLLPVLNERIAELKSEKRDLDEVREEMKKAFIAVTMPGTEQPSSDDISHLIRKKRPSNVLTTAESNEQTTKDENVSNVEKTGQSPLSKKARVEVAIVEETVITTSESTDLV